MTGGVVELKPASVDAMFRAVELVHERLNRAASALDEAGIGYAVIGAHAVAAGRRPTWPCGSNKLLDTPNG